MKCSEPMPQFGFLQAGILFSTHDRSTPNFLYNSSLLSAELSALPVFQSGVTPGEGASADKPQGNEETTGRSTIITMQAPVEIEGKWMRAVVVSVRITFPCKSYKDKENVPDTPSPVLVIRLRFQYEWVDGVHTICWMPEFSSFLRPSWPNGVQGPVDEDLILPEATFQNIHRPPCWAFQSTLCAPC